MNETTTPVEKVPAKFTASDLSKAKESLSIVTTLLISPGENASWGKSPKTFYAHFLMRMNVQYTDRVPTAGVSVTDKLNLYINPLFWNSLTTIQQMELVEHEVEHIVFMHPLRAKNFIGTEKNVSGRHKCANIAMDANINENKPNLCKDNGVTIARLNEELKKMGSKERLDIKDPWEVHYPKLMQAAQDNPEKGEGGFGDSTDDHSVWEESTDSKEVAEAIIKDAANKAQQATGIGNMPTDMLREISNMNKATINWKRELRQFFVNSLKYDFEKTRSRRNRRYGLIQPGRRKKPNLNIAVCVDSSGSVSEESFSQFFAEIADISKMGVDITILDADCEVQSVYKFDPKKKVQRTGMGGTAYSPAINKAKELGVDGIIYFGDFDCADTPTNPGVPFLWAGVGNQPAPASFGRVIRVVPEKLKG